MSTPSWEKQAMLLKTAYRIIVHEKEKFAGAVAGCTIAVFLMILQWGFYLGYDRDITVVLDSVNADIWIIPKNQALFDSWLTIDDLPYWKLRQHPDVSVTSRIVWGWAAFRHPKTGGTESVEVLGVDFESGIRLKLDLIHEELASMMRPDGHVMVGEKDRDKFGIDEVGVDGVEIYGRRAVPVGFVPDIHLFTTAGFVLTSLDNSRSFLRLPASHATYLVAKCCPGTDIEKVAAELQQVIPEHDVLTSQTFHDMTAHYWATRTGIGPVLLMSSGLAVSVGFLIVMLAFYISTIEKIPIFACMKALGASDWEVVKILIFQSVIVFVVGSVIAGVGLYVAVIVISQTTISVVITTNVVLTGLGTTALVSAASSLLSVRRVLTTDPGEAFRS